MKKTGMILLGFLLAATLCTSVHAEEEKVPIENVGISMSFPEQLWDMQGFVQPYPLGPLDDQHHVYAMTFIYEGMPADQAEELLYANDLPEEKKAEVKAKQSLITVVLTTDADLDTAAEAYEDYAGPDFPLDYDAAEELGTADGYTFYAIPLQSGEFLAQIDEEYAAEYQEMEQLLLEAERNADFFAPDDPVKDMVGRKLEFMTTDAEGNPVTSEELFSANEITMLNCWGLWCPHCVSEMEDLAEIHQRMQEKGCGIVGLEYESVPDEETYADAAAFLEESGVTYPNVLLPDELLSQISGFPTSIFVDKEGTVLSIPLAGPRVDSYESTLDQLLSETAAAPVKPENTAKKNSAALFQVIVTDEEGPVEGVAIQFCDDTTCSFEFTDADGVASMEGTAGNEYDVHVLKVPDGYQSDDTVYQFSDSSELTIQLRKES